MGAYEETLDYLLGLEVARGWDLKLDRVRAALARRGNPERAFATLHIAGTNGKGSTAAVVESILRAAGHRTGLFTSPHLVDFCERMRAGGATIPRDAVVALVAELRAAFEGISLTHFELATLLAFEWFARIGVEVAVVEVGLGGRLDATNVTEPLGTAITSIALDHEAWLGQDVATIAGEKAGIVKAGVPLVAGVLPEPAARVVGERAAACGAPLWWAGRDVVLAPGDGGLVVTAPGGIRWDELTVGLPGAFQRANAEVALGLLAATQARLPTPIAAVRAGLRDVVWPGRLARVGRAPVVLLDGAHNPDAIAALAPELAGRRGRLLVVMAVMADKAWEAMAGPLAAQAAAVFATRVGRRALDPETLAAALRGRVPVEIVADPRAAVRAALAAAGPDDTVLVTGSLFLVGEAYAELLGPDARLFPVWQGWQDGAREPPR